MFTITPSYTNYLDLKSDRVVIDQYRSALSIYINNANVPAGAKGKVISDLTDRKYENYQENLSDSIQRYQCKVTGYNKQLIQKRAMKNSLMWNWVIIGPDDDMKVIQMEGL